MFKPQKTEAEQHIFFKKSYEKFLQAKSTAGEINFYYRIGNTIVCLKFAGNQLVPYLTPALEHLRMTDDCVPDFTICIWDSDSTNVEMVPPPCTKDCFTDRGDIWGFNSRRIKAAFHWIECSVNLIDLEEKTGIYWVQTAQTLPYWVLASPLRTIFHWWMENNGCQLLHAAAVGTEKGAVLITGKGGVGKSTTALACLQRGFFYLADDYVIVKIEPTPTVVSLYSTAKLNADHVSNFSDLSRFVNNTEKLDQEKAVIFLNSYLSKKLVFEMPLKVILTPQIIDRRSSTIAPVSRWELQHAMSFTSMSQLPYMGRYAYDYIDRLIKELPHYRLVIGSDFTRIPIVVSDLLNDSESGRLTCHETPNDQEGLEEKPLISVIIPVFNGERFIREAVQNIISQNYPALEIIIVNDGSYDETEDIIKQLPVDLRYFSQPNSGPAAARNRGIRNASGDFIAFLDVDDLWPENNLHSLMGEMLQYPELCVVRGYGQLMEYDAVTNIYNFIGSPKDSFFHFIGAGLYRKTVFEKVGLFDPTLRFAEDSDWYIRAAELGIKMKRLEETRLYVRRHGQNMTEGKNIVELNTLKLFKKFIDRKRMPQS
jgi:GT2 family glycosyltransferase